MDQSDIDEKESLLKEKEENAPKHKGNVTKRGENIPEHKENVSEQRVTKIARRVTYFMYFLTGQYASPTTSPNKSLAMTFYFFLMSLFVCCNINIFLFVITVVEWILCVTEQYNEYYGVCYSLILHPRFYNGTATIPNIVLRDLTDETLGENADNLRYNQNDLMKFTIYNKLMLLLTSFSSMISYLLFLFAFMKLYFFPHIKKVGLKCFVKFVNLICGICVDNDDDDDDDDDEVDPLHPFNDEDYGNIEMEVEDIDTNTSTRLTKQEAKFYFSALLVNILIIIGMLVVFSYGQYGIEKPYYMHHKGWSNWAKVFEIFAVFSYIFSTFCTLLSCFLFSKIAYGIQNRYKNFRAYLKHVNKPRESYADEAAPLEQPHEDNESLEKVITYLKKIDEERKCERNYEEMSNVHIQLYYLQERDKHFTKVAKHTIKRFESWFFFHWILYIVCSFMSLSLFLEVLVFYINSSLPNQDKPTEGIDFHPLEITFLGFFSASNCLFFLYPCIRAASVTNSREAQISELNKIYTNYQYITPELKDRFAEYLRSQNAGFELHILCARVPFGFSIAYISIFIALFSVLVKVGTSI